MAERSDKDLTAVTQNLRNLIDSLRQQREQWQVPRPAVPAPAAPAPPSAPQAAPPEPSAARPSAEERSEAEERLGQRVHELELENQRLYDESVAMAEQSAQLANLYVALERLHGTLEHGEVLVAVDEVVTGMVGSEDFAILGREPGGPGLRVLRGHGVAAQRVGTVVPGQGPLGRLVARGTPWLGGPEGAEAGADVVACVPLKVGTEVTGAIVIFDLLAHKPLLTPADGDLLQLLGRHAASALHLTAGRSGSEPR